jgi:hypothetical protein
VDTPITDPTLTVYHEPELIMFWTEIDPVTNDVRLRRVTLPVRTDPARLIVVEAQDDDGEQGNG